MDKTLKNAQNWLLSEFWYNGHNLIKEYLEQEENEHIMQVEFHNGVCDAEVQTLIVDTIEKKAYNAFQFVNQVMMTDLVYIKENVFPRLEEL